MEHTQKKFNFSSQLSPGEATTFSTQAPFLLTEILEAIKTNDTREIEFYIH